MSRHNKMYLYPLFRNGLLLVALSVSQALAQIDTLEYHVGAMFGASTQSYLPHWVTANRFGILDDNESAVGLLRGGIASTYKVSKNFSFNAHIDGIAKQSIIKDSHTSVFLQQAYLKLKYSIFELSGGRMERTLGTPAADMSGGSLALSGNARPIPEILLTVPEYNPVPFTKGFVAFKGTYAHAWLGKDRYVKDAYLHEKSLYLKFGGKFKVNFSAGLVHYVIWGGKYPSFGELPSSFKDYIRLVLGKSAEGVDLNNPVLLGEASNALGDNLGIYDFGLYTHLKNVDLLLYQQTPFEDWSGTRLFKNRDRLLGIHINNKGTKQIVSGIVYEFLYTKYQSGPGLPGGPGDKNKDKDSGYGYDFGGRDNYYNNYLYKTGWVYQDRIIGTPLFFTKSQTKRYIEGFMDPDEKGFDFNVVNNRVVAHHIGIMGYWKNLNYKLLSTFTKNYGTYGGINGGINKWGSIENPDLTYAFKPPKNQNYFLLQIESHPFSKSWSLVTAMAWDTGELSHNVGALIGIKRKGLIRIKNQVVK